ncbi:MAG TPA: FecR domain-containing protein [Terriglobia bacterium]|nr:FecR domain-containing protein [Terriglobia bacterium]
MFKPRWLGTIVALPLLLTLDGLGAGNLKRAQVVGSIAGMKGIVLVDQHPVLDKQAVFSGEVVSTGASSGVFLNLRGTVAILVENSELALTGSGEATAMALRKGALQVRSGSSQPARIYIGKASVVVRNDGDFPSICRIASVDKSSVVIADRGHVEIHGAGAPLIVPPGKTVRLEDGMPQAAGQLAGKVSGEIPSATDQRGGSGNVSPLNLSDAVYLEDLVATQANGRVRIALLGGSFLNVGARSQMRIVQHDAQSQQTEVELKLGTLRGEVVKLTKGGKFETRTPTAVIGVVGTIYVANVTTPQDTGVWSITGDVTVKNIDPNVLGTVVLHTGQFTHVGLGVPPSAPTVAPAGQVQTQLQHTDIEEGQAMGTTAGVQGGSTGGGATTGTQVGTGGGAAASAAPGISIGITGGLAVGASAISAVVGGIAIHGVTQAQANVSAAQSTLSDAANAAGQAAISANNAQTAATQAVTAAQQANNIATTIANQVNSILQGCGCVSPSGP